MMLYYQGKNRRPALTLLEILVLLVILAILAGFFVYYIARQREEANRIYCANNLMLLGKAINVYHDQTGYLPPARIGDGYASWAVVIAPQLKADHPLTKWDLTKPYAEQSAQVRETWLAEMRCPTRARRKQISEAGDGAPGAVGDYGCVSGTDDEKHPYTGPSANGPMILAEILEEKNGRILRWRSRTSLDSLKRGTSTTLLLGEKHVPLGTFGQTKEGDGPLYNGQYPASFARIGGPAHGLAKSSEDPFLINFGSWHNNVCQFLVADMSYRAVTADIDEHILGEMLTRD